MRSAARAPRTLRPRGLPSGPLLALALLCLAEPAACRSPPASDRAARSLLQSAADDAEGFLSGSLPLEIVATTPSDLGAAPRRAVDGSQALTVAFSRSVIAIGEDFGADGVPEDKLPFKLDPEIPGRFRWVTTSIFRFDPTEEYWPDHEIELNWNEELTTFDGVKLNLTNASPTILVTPALTSVGIQVTSEMAEGLTDGKWCASCQYSAADKIPEVPSDGIIRLQFSHDVLPSMLEESMKVLLDDDVPTDFDVKVTSCDSDEPESPCVNVTITGGELEVDTRYFLVLEKGIKYSSVSGDLHATIREEIGGLRPFRIPLGSSAFVRSRELSFPLIHGLATGVTVEDLKKQVSLMDLEIKEGSQEMDFELRLKNKGELLLRAPFLPGRDYNISISANEDTKDGFGLPLLATTGIKTGEALFHEFSPIMPGEFAFDDKSYAIFESSQEWHRFVTVLSKGRPRKDNFDNFVCENEVPFMQAWPLGDAETAVQVLDAYLTFELPETFETLGIQDVRLTGSRNGSAVVEEMDASPLLDPAGIFFSQFCSAADWLTMESEIQASFIAPGAADAPGKHVLAWVHDMTTGSPVENAKVTIWQRNDDKLEVMDTAVTDADGMATLVNGNEDLIIGFQDGRYAAIEFNGRLTIVPGIVVHEAIMASISTHVSSVLDRKLARPGELMHVKGYIWHREGTDMTPLEPKNGLCLRVDAFGEFPVDFDAKFGSFEGQIEIPGGATPKDYQIYLGEDCNGQSQQEYILDSFTVGDPRPLTAVLEVVAPEWALPTEDVHINVSATSLIGSGIGEATMQLEWRVEGGGEANGQTEFTTDDSGMAAVAVNLTGLEVTPSLPSSLLIEIQWIGPTRELIRRSATVKLRAANVEIVHVRTLDTDVPGVAFGVSAIATDLQGGPIDGPVSISLVDIRKDIKQQVERTGHDVLQAVAKEPLNGKVLKTCESSSDKGDECRFQLEDMGRFALESCVEDKDGNRACFRTFLGKNKTEWKENPWGDFIDIKLLRVSDGVVKVGDTVEFQIENIYKDASALVMWGSSLGLDKKVIPLPDKQLASISVPVDETCAAGCSALVHINVPRQEEVDVNPHGIPSTIYYDPAMPRTVTLQEEIRVGQDRIVGVELLFPDLEIPPGEDTPIMAPQDATPISVSVGPCPGAEEPLSCNLSDGEDVEFTVVAVDKAVLELVPYELKDMALDFVFHLALSFDVVSSSEYLHAPGAITALVKRFMKEQEDNPWAVIDNLIHVPGYTPRTGSGPLIVPLSLGSDDEGTNSTGPSAKPRARSFTAPPQNAEPSTPLPSALPEEAIRSQADFTAIPLFTTIGPVKGGFGTVDFTAPDNIGTFVVRAYAGTDKGRFGSTEAEVIVRRRLSLTPSSPRVVRVGDKFEAGVIVTVSGESASDVPVTVDLKIEDGSGDFLSVAGESQMEAVTDVDGQVEVRFVLEALALGEAAIFISADGGKGYKDALRLTVPVLGLQDAVAVATSFAIQATEGEGATAVEGLELPNALPGTGSIELLAGVGRLPAVLGHARQIMEADVKHSCPNDGSLELAHSGVPSVLQMYRLYTPDDGEELDPAAEELVAASEANFSIALANLAVGNLTHDEHGLRWWVACPPQRSKSNPLGRASIHMNAYGVWLAESLGALLQGTKRETFLDGSNTLQMLVDEYWRPALEAQLLSDASEERSGKNPRAIQLSTVALARLALGSAWTAPKGTDPQVVADLSMERLESEFDDLGMEGMAHVALTLLSSEGQDGMELVERAVAAWTSNIRVGARTAYIAACDGCAAPAGLMGNALALLAMTRAGAETGPFGEKLANYVASPPAGKFAYFANYIEKLAVMLSLGEYDASRGSTDPDLELAVTSGEVSLLQAEFTSPQSPLAVSTTPWAALTQMPEPLEFSAEGTGEVTVAALLNFVPAEPLLFPSYRGIYVEQAIQLVNASSDFDEPMGAPLAAVPLGSIVIVTVQITAPDSVGATTVRVLMPGGLEPVDPNIAGTSLGVCSFLTSLSFAFDCPDQETLPSAVTFRYDSLSAGTHVLRVRAVAATPGTFGLPPTAAFLNSQPEVMGLSAAGSFEVCSNCEAVARGPAGGPKECPQDCSGSGLCDLDEGTCLCFDGFVGEDCSMLAEA